MREGTQNPEVRARWERVFAEGDKNRDRAWSLEEFTAAAERLGCHKNTVQYRIRRAEEVLGRSVRERRVDLELALQAARWLGSAVLTADSHA